MEIVENWKDITGYEGMYQLSKTGKFRSLDRTYVNSKGQLCRLKGKILKLEVMKLGYLRVHLSNRGRNEKILAHVLVGKHYVDGYFEGAEINHEDGNKQNNNDWNLKWTSKSDNIIHSYQVLGRNKDVQKNKKAINVTKDGEMIGSFQSIHHAAKELKISPSNIFEAATNNRKTKGFTVLFA